MFGVQLWLIPLRRVVAAPRGLLVVCAGLWLCGLGAARAQDKVVLQRGGLGGRMTISGAVEEYTGEQVVIRGDSKEPPRTYPGSEVIEIQTTRTASHTRGLERLADGDVSEAVRELETALKKEPRAWVRRDVLATLVRCRLRQGDYVAAANRFLVLYQSDATTRHFGLIPLVWAPEPISREARDEARSWMAGAVEPARLIAASLLYDDPDWGKQARAELKRLSSSADPRVRVLAQMQAFRGEVATGNPGALQVSNWQRRIDELPDDLRCGPMYLLGRAYAARHDYELAAATLLWMPLIDDHDYRLAARACLEAGVALEKIGQRAEARTLFLEVAVRFAEAPFADEARELLKPDSAPTSP